jgi:hypothetical protein
MRKASLVGVLTGLAALAFVTPAFAAPATSGALQFGVGFRYGKELNEGDFNPWGTGLGIEGGYTLPILNVYLGGNAEYFFGAKSDVKSSVLSGSVDGHIFQLSAEGGYDIGLGPLLVLRPKLGIGFASPHVEVCTPDCDKRNDTNFLLAPGAKLLLFTSHFSLSADVRYALLFAQKSEVGDSTTGKAFIFSVGVGF